MRTVCVRRFLFVLATGAKVRTLKRKLRRASHKRASPAFSVDARPTTSFVLNLGSGTSVCTCTFGNGRSARAWSHVFDLFIHIAPLGLSYPISYSLPHTPASDC